MPNLICFPHYTCGGLLCDIFNQVMSPLGKNGVVLSDLHGVGKIGDSDSVYDCYDPEKLYRATSSWPEQSWVGSHCWPGLLDASRFGSIIAVTTHTHRSRVYRWVRVYHQYFCPSSDWQQLQGMDLIDKGRETAKNYCRPFDPVISGSRVINLEFSDIVEANARFRHLVHALDWQPHLERWQKANSCLYQDDLWNSAPVRLYHEAEYELGHQQRFQYE